MDFYHVLPSNTSPDYFPHNNASQYSTPLSNPYVMNGNWEVGLMGLTYSTRVNTFMNDEMIIKEHNEVAKVVHDSKQPIRVMLPVPKTPDAYVARRQMVKLINEAFQNLLRLSLSTDEFWCTWSMLDTNFYYILGPGIENLFQLWSDVLTTGDERYTNEAKLYLNKVPTDQKDVFIIVAPTNSTFYDHKTFNLKAKNEKITQNDLFERFKSRVEPNIATLTLEHGKKFVLTKLYDDNKLILLNEPLRKALTFERRGQFHAAQQRYLDSDFEDMKPEWTFTVIVFKNIVPYQKDSERKIILPPISYKQESLAIDYVNDKIKDKRITFSCNATNHIILKITDKDLKVIFDDVLRDIFGFDKNIYFGPKSYTASGVFSLKRCIQYLYIYSNITNYIRIGNTESPLLAVIPFSIEKSGKALLKEKIFQTPMYIPVSQERISQIDIGIYDGTGNLIPFVEGAVTTLRLHFRPT